MQESACLFCNALQIIAGCFLDSIRAPVCTNICEDLCTAGKKLHKQHAKAVEGIILCCQNIRLSCTVPVKGRIAECLCEISVRIEISPLSLSLETGSDGIMSNSLLFSAFRKIFISIHQILDDTHHFDDELPVTLLLLVVPLYEIRVLIPALFAVGLCPG